jgi:hypothetical protein
VISHSAVIRTVKRGQKFRGMAAQGASLRDQKPPGIGWKRLVSEVVVGAEHGLVLAEHIGRRREDLEGVEVRRDYFSDVWLSEADVSRVPDENGKVQVLPDQGMEVVSAAARAALRHGAEVDERPPRPSL